MLFHKESMIMNSTASAMLRAARSCIAEAQRADRLGQHRYAELLRGSARAALAGHDVATPRQVDPETAKRQERARVFASVVLAGYGQVH
jgi:hypothetical protein